MHRSCQQMRVFLEESWYDPSEVTSKSRSERVPSYVIFFAGRLRPNFRVSRLKLCFDAARLCKVTRAVQTVLSRPWPVFRANMR